jgi:hypothetical protein
MAATLLTVPSASAAKKPADGPSALPRHANVVTYWNMIATDAFTPSQGTNPMEQSRTLAIMQAAVHDAVNAIDRRYEAYTPGVPSAPGASVDAAVAAASREVLMMLLPAQAALIQNAYDQALAAIPDGPAKTAGMTVGTTAARANIQRRNGDGSDTAAQPAYVPKPGTGEYQFTPPFNFAAQPGWGRVKPFVINLQEHELEGPQPVSSAQYARDLEFVKRIGHKTSTTRTAEESAIAEFWYEDSPLGWNRIANTAARQRGLDAWSSARLLALVNFAMADGFIAGFEAKYRFRFWRPETAIRQAATDGNGLTDPDPSWQPFLITPPVPDYPSTHTVLGWAAAEVLMELLGDRLRYNVTSLTLPDVTRSYKSFSEAAEENGMSRIYAGVHFRHAVRAGRQQGRSIGQAVAEALAPVYR